MVRHMNLLGEINGLLESDYKHLDEIPHGALLIVIAALLDAVKIVENGMIVW